MDGWERAVPCCAASPPRLRQEEEKAGWMAGALPPPRLQLQAGAAKAGGWLGAAVEGGASRRWRPRLLAGAQQVGGQGASPGCLKQLTGWLGAGGGPQHCSSAVNDQEAKQAGRQAAGAGRQPDPRRAPRPPPRPPHTHIGKPPCVAHPLPPPPPRPPPRMAHPPAARRSCRRRPPPRTGCAPPQAAPAAQRPPAAPASAPGRGETRGWGLGGAGQGPK